jgi:hypothetical protein
MEQSVEKIIERNLLEVFNGRDADSRRRAINELWDRDGVFIDPDGVHEGIEKINATVELLFTLRRLCVLGPWARTIYARRRSRSLVVWTAR